MPIFPQEKARQSSSQFSAQTNIDKFPAPSATNPDKIGVSDATGRDDKQGFLTCNLDQFVPLQIQSMETATTSHSTPSKADLLAIIRKAPAMTLRRYFKPETDSHRAMLERVAKGKVKCVKRWRRLRDFLFDVISEIGRRPSLAHTLDRVDNNNRKYGPGLCRWALPTVQNNNRCCSKTVKHPETGKVWTAAEIAKFRGKTPKTIRVWISEGKSAAWIFGLNATSPNSEVQEMRSALGLVPSGALDSDYLRRQRLLNKATLEQHRADVLAKRGTNIGMGEAIATTPDEFHRIECECEGIDLSTDPDYDPAVWAASSLREAGVKRWREELWPDYRPYVVLKYLAPEQRRFIEEIDPDWVAAKLAEEQRTNSLANIL